MDWPIHSAIKFIVRHTCRIKGYSVITIDEAEKACRIAACESIRTLVTHLEERLTDHATLNEVLAVLPNEMRGGKTLSNHGNVYEDPQEDQY